MTYAVIAATHKHPCDLRKFAQDFTMSVGQVIERHGMMPLGGISIASTPDEVVFVQAMVIPDLPVEMPEIILNNGSTLH